MDIRYSLYVHYDAQLYTQNQQGEHEIKQNLSRKIASQLLIICLKDVFLIKNAFLV